MDVDESNATTARRDAMGTDQLESVGQQYWPYNVTNGVLHEGQGPTDFTVSVADYGVNVMDMGGQLEFADRQYCWPYNVTNDVHQAQWSMDDGPTYDKVVDDDDMCLVDATTDDGSGSESDSSDGVIIVI